MIEVTIPGKGKFEFRNLVLDLNGTITLDGELIEGVPERLALLDSLLDIYIVTADTLGKAKDLAVPSNTRLKIINPGNEGYQKLEFIWKLGSNETAAIGAGYNDSQMLREAALGICVVSPEGTSAETLQNCDILVPDINAALDLLIKKDRLTATLRG
ncbi:MAG: HAD hydrolase family protein [Dehalococcoidales bacterium]|nr:HAD hydrolase family protein [Dehalococcoidales bacterium]